MDRKPRLRWSALAGDRRGVAALEFALIAPVLLTIFFGMTELAMGMMAQRRVTHAASAIGDLVAQTDAQGLNKNGLEDIFSVSSIILTPFPTATLSKRVVSVTADADMKTMVDWSEVEGGGFSKPGKGTKFDLPAGLVSAAGDSVIVAETTYKYKPIVGFVIKQDLTFNEIFYLRPRQVAKVNCLDCT